MAVVTSRRWQHGAADESAGLEPIGRLAVLTTLLAYCQLVLGSQLRHLPAGTGPGEFRMALAFHLGIAAALVVHIALLAARVFRTHRREGSLVRPAAGLLALIGLQVVLGAATWVTKYGWPAWLGDYGFAAGYTVVADGRQQAWITTAHVATGSAILAVSLLVSLRSLRFAFTRKRVEAASPWLAEAAR